MALNSKTMKKKKLSYLIASILTCLFIAAVSFYSCEKEEILPNTLTDGGTTNKMGTDMPDPTKICGKAKELYLIAHDGAAIGKAIIFNDTKYFYVHFRCNDRYILGDAAMHISPISDQFPLDQNGNPLISEFDFKIKGLPLSSTRAIIVPISKLYGQSYVAASVQAKALRSEGKQTIFLTAWADGRSFGNTVKGKMFFYKKNTCTEVNGTFTQTEETH